MVPPTPKRMVWRVTEAPWRMVQRPLCCSCATFNWFGSLVSSQYLMSMRWMSRWRMLRSSGLCCLGKVDLLMAGGAADVLLSSLSCPLPLLRTQPPSIMLVRCFFIFVETGATSTASGQLEVNLYLCICLRSGVERASSVHSSFTCIRNLKILHSQLFAAA